MTSTRGGCTVGRPSEPRLTTARSSASYRVQNVVWIEGRLFGEAKFSSEINNIFNVLVEPRGIEPLTS